MVNVTAKQLGKNIRMSFGKIPEVLDMPNLIEIQKNSYKWFREEGLKEVFRDFSATDYNGNLVLTFTNYRFDDEHLKYKTIAKAKEHQATYASPLRVTANLWNKETGEVKESEIFMGDFPVRSVSSSPSSCVLRVPTMTWKRTRPARNCSSPRSSPTVVHGWNMRWTPTTSSMSASTRTARSR